jgi:hypothetical protein
MATAASAKPDTGWKVDTGAHVAAKTADTGW